MRRDDRRQNLTKLTRDYAKKPGKPVYLLRTGLTDLELSDQRPRQ